MVRGTGDDAILALWALILIATCCSPKAKACSWTSACLSWRVGVEANNVRAWPVVPQDCVHYVAGYMLGGQYDMDLNLVVDNIINYATNITLSRDAKDAWVLDVDDTLISNLPYYATKQYGGMPYDPSGFTKWALRAACPNIPQVLRLFNKLIQTGFKVILLTGRGEETFRNATSLNLKKQGYAGYYRLVLRAAKYKGLSAIAYKSAIRKQLVEQEELRIWGDVGDQWSDLQGDYVGNRTFKIPNPMYFVP